jgi:hypothetical protein
MSEDKTFTQDQVNAIVQDRLERERAPKIVEPRTYSEDSPHSFYADILNAARGDEAAIQRRDQHAVEVAHEIKRGTPEGRAAERQILNSVRSGDEQRNALEFKRVMEEIRSLSTGPGGVTASAANGSAAAFVTPFFLNELWAPYRSRERAFADQCLMMKLPDYGMHGYIPAIVAPGTKASNQTEAAAVEEEVPGTELEGSAVVNCAGRLTLTQQLLDRAASAGGASIDMILGLELKRQVEEAVDIQALGRAIAHGTAITGSNVGFKFGELYKDMATGRAALADEAGTRLRATHFFSTTDFYSFASQQFSTADERPIMQPQYAPGFPIVEDADLENAPKWSRFTGTVLPGGQLWFTDDNIPEAGTAKLAQLIVSAPKDAVVLLEGDSVTSLFQQTIANKLEVVLIERKYACAITRHAAGTAVITGTAYKASQS